MQPLPFTIREATEKDVDQVCQLFSETVLAINQKDYSAEQVRIWASVSQEKDRWMERLHRQYFILAELEGTITGFASGTISGYLDTLFVHKYFQRKGIAKGLLNRMESFVLSQGVKEIYTDASLTAKPFFLGFGFMVEAEQKRNLKGVTFINYRMRKLIGVSTSPRSNCQTAR